MKTEKFIQLLSNNRKLIAGLCKMQFFLSFYLFYYIHTPVSPLSQANQSDGNRVAREVGFDHHLTTSSPQPVPLIVCTLQHSFITTTNNAESCAHYTISGAVSWHLPARHSSPTRKARGSNPPGRTKSSTLWGAALFVLHEFCGAAKGRIRTARAPRFASRGAETPRWELSVFRCLHDEPVPPATRQTPAGPPRCSNRQGWPGRMPAPDGQ